MNNKIPIIGEKLNLKKNKINIYLKIILDPKILLKKITRKLQGKSKNYGTFDYRSLLKKYGKNSVIDSRHPKHDFEHVTNKQKEIFFPILKKLVKKKIFNILDFGCGVGRFTKDLGTVFNCNVVGVDTCEDLLNFCKKEEKVKFLHIDENCSQIKEKFDLIFITQVINGIPDDKVFKLANFLTEKINEKGYLFLAETTSHKNADGIWRARTKEKILNFFPEINLKHVSSYIDIDREVSIFFGNKIAK